MKEGTSHITHGIKQHFSLVARLYREHTCYDWQRFLVTHFIFFNAVLLLLGAIAYTVQFLATGEHAAALHAIDFAVAKVIVTILFILEGRKMISFGGLALIATYLSLGVAVGWHSTIQPATVAIFCAAILLAGILYGFWCSLVITAMSTVIMMCFWASALQTTMRFTHSTAMAVSFGSLLASVLAFYVCSATGGIIYVHYRRQKRSKAWLSANLVAGSHNNASYPTTLFTHDLSIDTRKRQVVRGKTAIVLRRKEYEILEYLTANKGQALTKSQIFEHVWHTDSQPVSLGVHVKHLRDKVDKPFDKPLIETLHSVGYSIKDLPAN